MKLYIYAVGLFYDGSPHLVSRLEGDPFVPQEWQLVHTQEIHLNIDNAQLLELCNTAKGLEYEIEARLDHLTGDDYE